MVDKKILDEANKNKVIQDAANKTKEQLERDNLFEAMHWKNKQKFIKNQMSEEKQQAAYNNAKKENDPEWDKIVKTAHEWFHGEQAGYDTFVSASSAQVNFICKLGPVAAKKIDIVLGGLPYTFVGQEINALIKNPTSFNPTEYQAPTLDFKIVMNDNNALTITKLEFIGDKTQLLPNQKVTREQIEAFQIGVVVWLMNNGYTPSATNAGKFTKDGQELDNAALEALNPEKNLSEYFDKLRNEANRTAPNTAREEANLASKAKQTSHEAWEKTAKEEAEKKRTEAADKKAEDEPEMSKSPRPK